MRSAMRGRAVAAWLVAILCVIGCCRPALANADVNQDGEINVLDVQGVVNIILSTTTPAFHGAGDLNWDNVVDVIDVQEIVNMSLGVFPFPGLAMNQVLPPGLQGTYYRYRFAVYGLSGPLAWARAGALPAGMSFSFDGWLSGTPTSHGTFPFEVTAVDASNQRITFPVSIFIQEVNFPPVAVADSHTVAAGAILTVAAPGVLGNDSDPNNDPLTASVLSTVTNGTLSLQPTGAFTYTAPPTFVGQTSFTYQISDGRGGTDTAVVTITITPPIPASNTTVSVTLSPNPVKTGDPLTLEVRIHDSGSNLPSFNNIQSVTIPGMPFGGPAVMPVPYDSMVDAQTGLYKLTLSTGSLIYGLHSVDVAVTTNLAASTSKKARFVAYTGTAQLVGPTRTHTTIQAGINACANFGAVLVDPGTYQGTGNRALTVSTPIVVAGIDGYSTTIIDCQLGGVGFQNPGPTDQTILMGLTVENGSDGGIKINSSPMLLQMRVRNSRVPTFDGGGIQITIAASNPKIIECVIENNVAGALTSSMIHGGGGVSAFGGSKFEMIDCLLIGNSAFGGSGGRGGAISSLLASVPGPLIQGTRIENNVAEGGNSALGGAIYATGHLRIVDCEIVNNTARSIFQTVQGPTGTITLNGNRAIGGAISISGSMLDVLGTLIDGNLAIGQVEGNGGAIYAQQCAQVVLDQCHIRNNTATGVTQDGEGGALSSELACSYRSDFCIFEGNTATGPVNARGGVLHVGTVYSTTPNPYYLGFHNCLIFDNAAASVGNVIYTQDFTASTQPPIIIFEHCTIADNTGGTSCLQIQKGSLTLVNTIMFGNAGTPVVRLGTGTLNVSFSNVHPALPSPYTMGLNGNLSVDPLFATLHFVGDYFLSKQPNQVANSPCIDAGTTSTNTNAYLAFPTTTDQSPDILTPDMGFHRIPAGTPLIVRSPTTAQQLRTQYPCSGTISPPVSSIPPAEPSPNQPATSGGGSGGGGIGGGGPAAAAPAQGGAADSPSADEKQKQQKPSENPDSSPSAPGALRPG